MPVRTSPPSEAELIELGRQLRYSPGGTGCAFTPMERISLSTEDPHIITTLRRLIDFARESR
jgi:hypothetical protein